MAFRVEKAYGMVRSLRPPGRGGLDRQARRRADCDDGRHAGDDGLLYRARLHAGDVVHGAVQLEDAG